MYTFFEHFKLRYVDLKFFADKKRNNKKKSEIMKILRGYQKQTRAGDGKLKPQFPWPNTELAYQITEIITIKRAIKYL